MKKTIVWTVAGSDSCGAAGLQADLKTFQALNVYGCSIITAVTAQNSENVTSINYMSSDFVRSQIDVLKKNFWPAAIKIGMMGNGENLQEIMSFLSNYAGHVVLDPIFSASSGSDLYATSFIDYKNHLLKLFPFVTLVTPNLVEAEKILGRLLLSSTEIEKGALDILALGVKSVLIKGGHFGTGKFSQDYWTDGKDSFWLAGERYNRQNYRGTGCVLASVIAAKLALGCELKDALVMGKMYVSRAIRCATKLHKNHFVLNHENKTFKQIDLPYLASCSLLNSPPVFKSCGPESLGLYPIVDNVTWLKKLLPLGVTTIQLRIKDKVGKQLENEIQAGIKIANYYNARLFINDYWEYALQHHAYGVHLGQNDLHHADLKAIRDSGLRLGISTHCFYEVARAHAIRPSYIACGPIFPTTSKVMPFSPQGVKQLKKWCQLLDYPLVAIGGIDYKKLPQILQTQVSGVAMISAIVQSQNPTQTTKLMLAKIPLPPTLLVGGRG